MAHGFAQMRRMLTDFLSVKILKIRVIRVLFWADFFVKKIPQSPINTGSRLQRSRKSIFSGIGLKRNVLSLKPGRLPEEVTESGLRSKLLNEVNIFRMMKPTRSASSFFLCVLSDLCGHFIIQYRDYYTRR